MDTDAAQPAGGPLAGLSETIQQHLEEYQQGLAATRGAQAALQASLDRLQAELAAAEAAVPHTRHAATGTVASGQGGPTPSARLAKLRERLQHLSRQAAEVEHRVERIRRQLAQQAAPLPSAAEPSG